MDYAKLAADVREEYKYAYSLAGAVGVSSPDSLESAGALFLYTVRESLLDEIERIVTSDYPEDEVSDIADHASVVTNTYETWKIYIDLELYNFDSGIYSDDDKVKRGELTEYAKGMLWEVASDLSSILYGQIDKLYKEQLEADEEREELILEIVNLLTSVNL